MLEMDTGDFSAQFPRKLERYLGELLHGQVDIRPAKAVTNIPAFIDRTYLLLEAQILGRRCIIMARLDGEGTPADIAKHVGIVRNATGSIVAFATDSLNAYNRARELKQRLVVSGDAPPLRLALREDLRTRIGQSLVFHVEPLDDAQRLGFLQQWAQARGMRLERDVATYVLHRIERDPRRLAAFVAALDRRSLERQRPVTVALAREVLAELEAEPLRDESGLSNKE